MCVHVRKREMPSKKQEEELKAITNGGKVRFKEQSFFLSFHPQLKIESAIKYLYEHDVAFPAQCLSGVQGEREKRSVILPARVLLSSRYACVFMGRSYNNKSTA